MPQWSPQACEHRIQVIPVVVFTLIYTLLMAIYGVIVDSPLTGLYTGINVGLFILFALINVWARWPNYALWALSLVGFGNMAGGVLLVAGEPLYLARVVGELRYDKVFHALAAAALVTIAWEAMKKWSGGVSHLGGQLLLTFLVVMGGGAVVEIAELVGSNIGDVSVGDYTNNAFDLVANAVGAAVGVAIVWLMERGGQRLTRP